jgi:hypothetical protein
VALQVSVKSGNFGEDGLQLIIIDVTVGDYFRAVKSFAIELEKLYIVKVTTVQGDFALVGFPASLETEL